MRIGILGINHKQASLAVREKIAKLCNKRFADHRLLHPQLSYVLLSTCNRTEIYFQAPELAEAHIYLLNILRESREGEIEQKIYSYFGMDCFRHLARVTSGLDSAILGESEIQRQVKIAYQEAAKQRVLPSELHFLFQKALKIGKEVRTHYPMRHPTLEGTLYTIASERLGELEQKKVLFMGISRINTMILSWFVKKKVPSITFCNRTFSKLQSLDFPYLRWEERERWVEFDLIILGTKSPEFIIDHVPPSVITPKLLIDLSVPRNVAPAVGTYPGVTLLNIDQLSKLNQREHSRLRAIVKQIDIDVIERATAH